MEKIKLSLWDIFVYISSAIVIHLALALNEYFLIGTSISVNAFDLLNFNNEFVILFVSMFYFLIFGKLLEPLANEVFTLTSKLVNHLKAPDKSEDDKIELKQLVIEKILNDHKIKVEGSPYHYVKDFLTDQGRNALFLVFLSRYGFYRNCYFVTLVLIVRNIASGLCIPLVSLPLLIILAILYYRRTNQFLSFQEPTLYRTFLMGK